MYRMKSRINAIFEVLWFVLGGTMLFMAVDLTLKSGFRGSWIYYLLSLLAYLFYFYRRKTRLTRR